MHRIPQIMGYILILSLTVGVITFTSRTVTVLSEESLTQRESTIIIDPGHGGEDGGAVSLSGKPESSYNLQISIRLRDLLTFMGYDTIMTREADISIYTKGETLAQKKASDLKERLRIVNDTKNAILLSIHQNYFSDSRYHGAQVFYADTPESRQLASRMQAMFLSTVNPGSNRQEKHASGIYLMEHIQTTGVLIECGFLSNPQEEAALGDPVYQKNICCIIATSLDTFLRENQENADT